MIFIKNAAKSVLLPPTETCFWLEHLQTFVDNRRRDAAKAAATRRARSKKNMKMQSKFIQKTKADTFVLHVERSTRKKLSREKHGLAMMLGITQTVKT